MTLVIWLIICGLVFGIANVIPGVSGGTLAVVMNVYDELIDSIANFTKHVKKSIKFLVPFLIGAGTAILLFSKLVKMLLDIYPMQVNFFFIGLMLGSIPLIFIKAFGKESSAGQSGVEVKPSRIIAVLIGLGIMILMTFLSPSESGVVTTELTASYFFIMLLSGIIAAVTMIIPGISGSLMLLVLGVYNSVIAAVSDLNIMILIPFAIGVLIGFLLGTKLVAICLEKAPKITYCLIFGLLIGSLLPVFKAAGFTMDMGGVVAILIMIVGAVLAFFMSRESKAEIEE